MGGAGRHGHSLLVLVLVLVLVHAVVRRLLHPKTGRSGRNCGHSRSHHLVTPFCREDLPLGALGVGCEVCHHAAAQHVELPVCGGEVGPVDDVQQPKDRWGHAQVGSGEDDTVVHCFSLVGVGGVVGGGGGRGAVVLCVFVVDGERFVCVCARVSLSVDSKFEPAINKSSGRLDQFT